MSKIGLTKDERALVEVHARDTHGVASRLGFYASVLVPVVIFGIYGFVRRDFLAATVALVALLIFVCWRLSYEFTRLSVHRSVFQKVLNHEQSAEAAAQQTVEADGPASGGPEAQPGR